MPGLLDLFTSTDPGTQQGLLASAAQILQASGPSLMPHSFGQIVGQGLGAYQQGMQGYQDREQQKRQADQLYQVNDVKLQDAQADLANQQLIRDRAKRIADRLVGTGGAQLPGQGDQQSPMASALPGGAMSPKVGGPDWMQAYQQQNGLQPTSPAALAQAAPRVNQTDAYVQRLLSAAQVYAEEGDLDGANKLYDQAAKLRPKYSTEFRQAQDASGKLRNYVLADDGTLKDTGLGVAPNLTEVDLGGTKQFVDKNAVAPGQVFKKTLSPDAAASSALGYANLGVSRDRLALDQQNAGKPTFNADAGGFISPPSAANPSGAITPLPGFQKPEKAPTEFQGKSAAYALRATEADKILGSLQGKYSPAAINSKNTVANTWLIGGALGAATNKFALTENDQRADQAQRDFINAILRQESGAAIGAGEFDNAAKQYFPQPGDTAPTLAQKARGRALAIQGLQANAGKFGLMAPTVPAAGGWSITKVE